MSLVQRCPYFRVSFKRGSTVFPDVPEFVGCSLKALEALVQPQTVQPAGGGRDAVDLVGVHLSGDQVHLSTVHIPATWNGVKEVYRASSSLVLILQTQALF